MIVEAVFDFISKVLGYLYLFTAFITSRKQYRFYSSLYISSSTASNYILLDIGLSSYLIVRFTNCISAND